MLNYLMQNKWIKYSFFKLADEGSQTNQSGNFRVNYSEGLQLKYYFVSMLLKNRVVFLA